MDKCRFIMHKGKSILSIDFSNTDFTGLQEIIKQTKTLVARQPKGSLLTLTNFTDVKMSPEINAELKEYANHNKPFVKAGGLLGVTGLKRLTYKAVLMFTGRKNLKIFDNQAQAVDWLAEQ